MQYHINEVVDVIQHTGNDILEINSYEVIHGEYVVKFRSGNLMILTEQEFLDLCKPLQPAVHAPSVLNKPDITQIPYTTPEQVEGVNTTTNAETNVEYRFGSTTSTPQQMKYEVYYNSGDNQPQS
jgi:hypothetical protein